MQVAWDGGTPQATERQSLKVDQTAGSSFGYRVRSTSTGEPADLNAFPIEVPAEAGAGQVLVEADDDLAAFRRTIVVVHDRQAVPALALAFLPLAIYLVVVVIHRRRMRRAGSAS